MTTQPRINVLRSPFQNAFYAELAEVLVAELLAIGIDARPLSEPHTLAPTDADVFVLLPPHEWTSLEGEAWMHDRTLMARTIGIGAEQPHSAFFRRNAEIGRRIGALLDFSARTVDAFRVADVDAVHLPFGYTSRWDRFRDDGNADGPDIVFLGNFKERRLDALARLSATLGAHHSHLVLGDNSAPNTASSRWFVAGDDKRSLLASSKVLLNIHQSTEPYFEWLRFTEAALCGTVMLSEPSTHTEPFTAGVHFAESPLGGMADELERLLSDHAYRASMRRAAYDEIASRPFSASLGVLVEIAEALTGRPVPSTLPPRLRTAPLPHRHSLVAAPSGPSRRPEAAARVDIEIITIAGTQVDGPAATEIGRITVREMPDRAAAIDAARASSAALVGVVTRPARLQHATIAAMQRSAAAGAGAVLAMAADAAGWRWTLRGLWHPTAASGRIDSIEQGFLLAAPRMVAPDGTARWQPDEIDHVPSPAITTTVPIRSGVAIVLATFNPAAGLFHRQVESIRAQTYDNFVCLITDDGSADHSRAFIRRAIADDSRFILLEHAERVGFYRNFERGIEAARAMAPAFVALSDQDDIWFPDKLERAVGRLEATGAPMVFADVVPVTDDRRIISATFFWRRRPVHHSEFDLTLMNCAIGATSMARAELLDTAMPFPEQGFRSFHDHWLARCAQRAGGLAFEPTASMEYVQHGRNVQGAGSARVAVRDFLGIMRQEPTSEWDDDTALVRRRLHELDVLDERYGPTRASRRLRRVHEHCLAGRRRAIALLIALWVVDQRLRPRSRRENVEIRYLRAALVARRGHVSSGASHAG